MFPKIVVPPKSSILIGFSIIFTIHFGVPLFLVQHPNGANPPKIWDGTSPIINPDLIDPPRWPNLLNFHRVLVSDGFFPGWLVVSNIYYFHPYLGKIPILTNIFQRGWNHQQAVNLTANALKKGRKSQKEKVYVFQFHDFFRGKLLNFLGASWCNTMTPVSLVANILQIWVDLC